MREPSQQLQPLLSSDNNAAASPVSDAFDEEDGAPKMNLFGFAREDKSDLNAGQVETADDGIGPTTSRAPLNASAPDSTDGSPTQYKSYKRRWFGLFQLALLNIVVSWSWLTYSPVVNDAATFFSTTPSIVNWLSTVSQTSALV